MKCDAILEEVMRLKAYKPPFGLKIRPCLKADLERLQWDGSFKEHQRVFNSALRRQKQGKMLMLLAEVNHSPVGQIWIECETFAGDEAGFFSAFRVSEPFQSLGIGQQLLAKAEELIDACGLRYARLGVEESNNDAFGFYERRGYEAIGSFKEVVYYRSPDGARRSRTLREILMQKDCRPA